MKLILVVVLLLLSLLIKNVVFGKCLDIDDDTICNIDDKSNLSKSRDAIVLLIKNINLFDIQRYRKFINMFESISNWQYPCTLIIFHESFPLYKEMIRMREIAYHVTNNTLTVDFVNIEKVFYKMYENFNVFNYDHYNQNPTWYKHSKWGYHQMIRFFFSDIFNLSIMRNVDYFLRLDDDSRILNNIIPDIFKIMRDNNYVYMANDIKYEDNEVLRGTSEIIPIVKNYVKDNNIKIKSKKRYELAFNNQKVRSYYNNFEVVSIKFFNNDDIKQFNLMINNNGGIFKYRWGDAVLRYLVLAIFAEDDQIINRNSTNIMYCHPCTHE